MTDWRKNVHFVLVEPEEPGNIGAAARAIKNMGFSNLCIVNPPAMTAEAEWFAHNALDVLDSAKVYGSVKDAVADKALVVGTARRKGKSRGLILPLDQGVQRVIGMMESNSIALLFGRESRGLLNEEVDLCGILLTIQASKAQPSLNLGQAVMVVAYELSKAGLQMQEVGSQKKPAHQDRLKLVTHQEVAALFERMTGVLKRLDYIPRGDRDLETKIMANLRHFIGRAGLTDWELNMLYGICSQIEKKIWRCGSPE